MELRRLLIVQMAARLLLALFVVQSHFFCLHVAGNVTHSQHHLFVGRIKGARTGCPQNRREYLKSIKRSIAGLCDWVIIERMEDGTAVPEVIKQRSPPRTIYISFRCGKLPETTVAMMEFMLQNSVITSPVVLFSGSSDATFPNQTDKRKRSYGPEFNDQVANIASSSLVERWNVENLVGPYHPKMVPMPLGFIPSSCSRNYYSNQYPCDVLWGNINNRTPLAARPLEMMCTARKHLGSQFQLREGVNARCKEKGGPWSRFVYHPESVDTTLTHDQFMKALGTVSFVLCPHGGGIDPAPKAFEALAAGTIPIVQRSDL